MSSSNATHWVSGQFRTIVTGTVQQITCSPTTYTHTTTPTTTNYAQVAAAASQITIFRDSHKQTKPATQASKSRAPSPPPTQYKLL